LVTQAIYEAAALTKFGSRDLFCKKVNHEVGGEKKLYEDYLLLACFDQEAYNRIEFCFKMTVT